MAPDGPPGAGRRTSAIGVVAIGRNEGPRLAECLSSARGRPDVPIVYVDSDSTDGSADLARSMGVEVVELGPGRVHGRDGPQRGAGAARQPGVRPRIRDVPRRRLHPGAEAGSTGPSPSSTATRGWPSSPVAGENETARSSVFRRLMDIEWNTPVGEADACGGDAAMRVGPFRDLGGFEPTLAAGEEPEFCHRLRSRGWRILRVDAEMTCHDMGEASAGPWWRRNVRQGYAAEDVTRRFPGPSGSYRRRIISAWRWGVAVPACVLAAAALGPASTGWPPIACGLLASLIYPVQALRIAWMVRPRAPDLATAMAYGVSLLVAKWPHLQGQLYYMGDRWKGRSLRHLEYRPSREAASR